MPAPNSQAMPLGANTPHPVPNLSTTIAPTFSSWIPVHSIPASPYPLECFESTLVNLVHYPEHSSSTILRADILEDQKFDETALEHDKGKARETSTGYEVEGYDLVRRIRRKILPKRPQFDHSMEQECLFYTRRHPSTNLEPSTEMLVLFVVDLELLERETGKVEPPYYHPQAAALAFRYLPANLSSSSTTGSTLRIDLVPLPHSTLCAPLDPQDRLFRTSLSLLKAIDKMSKGTNTGFEKRIHHDLLVPKQRVQDVYQTLKSKYSYRPETFVAMQYNRKRQVILNVDDPSPRITFPRFLATSWAEKTDPSKHVFEDVAICAWLICLWQEMYPLEPGSEPRSSTDRAEPRGGFVDIGCGNGLLQVVVVFFFSFSPKKALTERVGASPSSVYLLNAEGYKGYGLDLRARKSWLVYEPRPDLRVTSLSPPTIVRTNLESSSSDAASYFPPSSFLIGNHADELTPWIPLFSATTLDSAFVNIPCCLHELYGRYESKTYVIPRPFLDSLPPYPSTTTTTITETEGRVHDLLQPFYRPHPSSIEEKSRYSSYQLYLAHLTLLCGFVPEREALRIPSTKNFGMVGRKRVWEVVQDGGNDHDKWKRTTRNQVERLVNEVERKAGQAGWQARVPEGNAGTRGDH
ncbi:tRNA (uracil) methyltransferase [Sporobolomyces koalae]|uniref:tRNA (uracil) methyltransferase n=1 Tax=Sporobolomyces koalae TaxID=500713 RepID=UPI00317C2917